jgi:hypothetical protein
MNERNGQSIFVTNFAIYGSEGFVKLEAFDMEPSFSPENNSISYSKGVPVRLVMPEGAFAALVKMVNDCAKVNIKETDNKVPVKTPAGMRCSELAKMVAIHMGFRKESERVVLARIGGTMEELSNLPNLNDIAKSISRKMDFHFNQPLPAPGDGFEEGLRENFKDLFLKFDKTEAKLFTGVACYVSFCESGAGSCDLASVEAITKEIANKV